MTECKFDIFDIMACDVYWDWKTPGLGVEQHKFLVSFYETEGKFTPDLVEKIVCTGPDNYVTSIANVEYTNENRNGWIRDPERDSFWYMHNCPTGFMKDGEYTIEVHCKNGDVKSKSRIQNGANSLAIRTSYLNNYEKNLNSYTPSEKSPMDKETSLTDVQVTWTPLKEFDGQDAYYIYRVCKAKSKEEFDGHKLFWWDNIFLETFMGNKDAGKNRDKITIGNPLEPKTAYTYFVECTNSNIMGETDICIFQPFRTFETP